MLNIALAVKARLKRFGTKTYTLEAELVKLSPGAQRQLPTVLQDADQELTRATRAALGFGQAPGRRSR